MLYRQSKKLLRKTYLFAIKCNCPFSMRYWNCILDASEGLWVIIIKVVWCSLFSRSRISITCTPVSPSRLPVGSSARTIRGLFINARALINRPRIVLADEPTGNLDGETGVQVMDILLRLNKEHQTTFIMITHNPSLASKMQFQYRMENGQLHLIANK